MEGVAFLYPRHAAMLADEMGLGKTMQAITAMRLLLHRRSAKGAAGLPQAAGDQLAARVPSLGSRSAADGHRRRTAKRRWQWQLADAPVKIANYELLQRDRDVVERSEPAVRPGGARRIAADQEPLGQHHQPDRALDLAPRSWALTGTPVENSPEDLVGIFEFLAPGLLHRRHEAAPHGPAGGRLHLRRTKDKVLTDLPPKMFRDADIDLTPEQRETYRLAEEEGMLRLTEMGEAATIQHVFELVLRLKQICNFDPATGASAKLERLSADLEEIAASGQQGDRLQPMGGNARHARRAAGSGSSRWSITARFRQPSATTCSREFRDESAPPRAADQLRGRRRGAESAVRRLRVPVRSLVESGRRRPGDQPGPSHRRRRAGDGDALPDAETRSKSGSTRCCARSARSSTRSFPMSTAPRLGLTQAEIFGLFRLKCPTAPVQTAG